MRRTAYVPGAGVNDPRIARLKREIDRTCIFVREKYELPILSTVGALINAARFTGLPEIPHRSDIDDVRIRWVDTNAPDVAGILEAEESPGLSGVCRFPDAEIRRYVAPHGLFAKAGVDDVRIRLRYRDGAHGSAEIAVGDIPPLAAAVVRFPDTPTCGREVVGITIARYADNAIRAATAVRSDQSIFHRVI